MECKQWQRARAEKCRYDEAVSGTCADLRATIRGFDTLSRCWTSAAEAGSGGAQAYAFRQVNMYEWMQDECRKAFDERCEQLGLFGAKLDQRLVRCLSVLLSLITHSCTSVAPH